MPRQRHREEGRKAARGELSHRRSRCWQSLRAGPRQEVRLPPGRDGPCCRPRRTGRCPPRRSARRTPPRSPEGDQAPRARAGANLGPLPVIGHRGQACHTGPHPPLWPRVNTDSLPIRASLRSRFFVTALRGVLRAPAEPIWISSTPRWCAWETCRRPSAAGHRANVQGPPPGRNDLQAVWAAWNCGDLGLIPRREKPISFELTVGSGKPGS